MNFYGQQNFQQNQIKSVVVDTGTAFPGSPIVGQLFFRSDTTPKKMFIFLGVGVPGTTSGWFDLTQAYYA